MASASDFFLYRRRLPAGKVFCTFYASGMSLATVFIAFFQLAPFLGTALIWAPIFYVAGHVLLWFCIPRILKNAGAGRTLHGFLGAKYGQRVQLISSIATCIGFLGVFATELIIGCRIFDAILGSGQGYWIALLFLTAVVLGYSLLGGFKSVVRTDFLQTIGILLVTVLLVWLAYRYGPDKTGVLIPSQLTASWLLPAVLMVNFFLINFPFPLVDMSAWQRVVAARDESSARKGVLTASIMFLVTWGFLLFAALALSEYATEDATGGLIAVFKEFAQQGPLHLALMACGLAALVGAMLSTADTFLIAAGQTIAMDITDRSFFAAQLILPDVATDESDESSTLDMPADHLRVINGARNIMLVTAIIGVVAAIGLTLIGFGVAELVFAVYGSALSLLPAVVVALAVKDNGVLGRFAPAAIASIVFGVVAGWGYGIIVVLGARHKGIWEQIAKAVDLLPGDPSAYNAPTYAFGIATIIMVLVAIPCRVIHRE